MWWLFPLLLTPCLALQTQEPPAPMTRSSSNPEERWLDVRLNHFMADNEETFSMRYYYNRLSGDDQNVVIFVGGEWEISPGWASAGLAYDIASSSRASLFYTEHRFYGKTRPSGDTSLSDLRYLTVDQALADLVEFITYVKSVEFERGQYRNATVTLVGCSYAGTMATWMRLAYPHLVNAVVSDSGPLHAQEDFPEYLAHLTLALQSKGGAECVSSIQSGIERIQAILAEPAGATEITEMFRTCSTIAAANQLDVATFFWSGIIERIAGEVQSAVPGDIENMCTKLTDPSVSDPARRLANYVNTLPLYPPTQPACLETRYTEMVAIARNTSYDSPLTSLRLWTYQTCVEYGWYQSTGANQPFGNTVPLEFFHQMCKDFFSSNYDETLLRNGISRTNLFFGGLTHLPDYVVSAQGELDPWYPMGPSKEHAGPLAPVYVLPGASHCRAIMPIQESETEEIRQIKVDIQNDIHYFLFGVRYSDATRAAGSVVLLLALVAASLI